jgi:hypothetical protein
MALSCAVFKPWLIYLPMCNVVFVCDGVCESFLIGVVSGFPWLRYSLVCEWCHKLYFHKESHDARVEKELAHECYGTPLPPSHDR